MLFFLVVVIFYLIKYVIDVYWYFYDEIWRSVSYVILFCCRIEVKVVDGDKVRVRFVGFDGVRWW